MTKQSIKTLSILLLILMAGLAVFFLKPKPALAPENQPTITYNPSPNPTTTIFFAGDIMLSRNVADRMYKANNFNLPFEKVADVIQEADIAFANLESPFNDTGRHFVDGSLIFNADPKSAEGLTYVGFDILSTANNHAFDQGQKGLDYTIDWLTAHNILPTGTTHSTAQLQTPVIKHNDLLFGFLAYSYTAYNDGGKSSSKYINDFNDLGGLKQDIVNMKGHTADIVIVNMHAGVEYTRTPIQAQVAFAHAAIDAGADLVVGEHPHWIQTIEEYKGKYIFYSLGNFVFDQMWSTDTKEGLTLLVTYENQHIPDLSGATAGEDHISIKKIELKPVVIEDFCCPRWANEEETKNILAKINPHTNSPIIMQDGKVNSDWK